MTPLRYLYLRAEYQSPGNCEPTQLLDLLEAEKQLGRGRMSGLIEAGDTPTTPRPRVGIASTAVRAVSRVSRVSNARSLTVSRGGGSSIRLVKADTESSYVPQAVMRHIRSLPADAVLSHASSAFPAAILFADISGFTPLTEKLSNLPGGDGAEQLLGALNSYFGRMVALIYASGGDVLKFAGDALLVMWPVLDQPELYQLPKHVRGGLTDLGVATARACQCALAMQEKLDNYEASPGIFLRLHTGVGAGNVYGLHVGGVSERWEFLIAGYPILQIASAEGESKSGECFLSAEAWTLVAGRCEGTISEATGNVLLHRVVDTVPTPRPKLVSAVRHITHPPIRRDNMYLITGSHVLTAEIACG